MPVITENVPLIVMDNDMDMVNNLMAWFLVKLMNKRLISFTALSKLHSEVENICTCFKMLCMQRPATLQVLILPKFSFITGELRTFITGLFFFLHF